MKDDNIYREQYKLLKKALRTAVADYMRSEGCSCCEGPDHKEHKEVIAKLLSVQKYSDGSGYDFSKYESKVTPTL